MPLNYRATVAKLALYFVLYCRGIFFGSIDMVSSRNFTFGGKLANKPKILQFFTTTHLYTYQNRMMGGGQK